MILKNHANSRKKAQDWSVYYKPETCRRVGINPELPLVVCGYQPEPQHAWNPDSGKYDGPINAYGYWVNQWIKDGQGNVWLQNPVMVVVDGNQPVEFQFGEKVKFVKMGAYYSRKKYQYLFRAKGVIHV